WMGLLAGVQVLLRLTLNLNLPWADIQLRQLVLAVGMGGGIIAAAEFRHIRIDLIEHLAPNWASRWPRRILAGLSALGAGILTYVSIEFVRFEQNSGSTLRGALFGLSIPNWWAELIIPAAFGLIAVFFTWEAIFPESSPPKLKESLL
ncbi:MAG: TRAP transporter small permease, partial [Calditrichota bacterium]